MAPRRKLLRYLISFLIYYTIALAILRLFEPHFLFYPDYPGRLEGDWNPAGLGVEDVWLSTSDHVKLHAWWIPAKGATYTFLSFHGNASNLANRADVYRFLHQIPVNLLAVEYRGYGKSEGSPSESGLYKDAQAGYDYLAGQRIGADRIVSFGQSLGTAVATNLASRNAVAALVLEAPFPSASVAARRAFWFLPGISLFLHGQLGTAQSIQRVRAPVMVIHCRQDPVIPFDLGQKVFADAHQPKTFLAIDAPCHEEASIYSPEKYKGALTAFIESLSH